MARYRRLGGWLRLRGRVRVTQRDAQNIVYDSGWNKNQVTNHTAQCVAAWLTGTNNTGYNPVAFPQYMELGTGTGTPAATDTALYTPVSATFQKCSVVQSEIGSPMVAQFVCQYYGTSANAGSYTEIGLFDASSNMFAHILQSVTITSGLSTTVEWGITVNP